MSRTLDILCGGENCKLSTSCKNNARCRSQRGWGSLYFSQRDLREQNGLQKPFCSLNTPHSPAPQARGSVVFEARKSCDFLSSHNSKKLTIQYFLKMAKAAEQT